MARESSFRGGFFPCEKAQLFHIWYRQPVRLDRKVVAWVPTLYEYLLHTGQFWGDSSPIALRPGSVFGLVGCMERLVWIDELTRIHRLPGRFQRKHCCTVDPWL